jgi:hypothetical protein
MVWMAHGLISVLQFCAAADVGEQPGHIRWINFIQSSMKDDKTKPKPSVGSLLQSRKVG